MRPQDLKPADFAAYTPGARRIAVASVDLFRRLPMAFLPVLLREVHAYDTKFPAERSRLDGELAGLKSLSADGLGSLLKEFAAIKLPPRIADIDWVNRPGGFVDSLSAALWASHQIDAFTSAAGNYAAATRKLAPAEPPLTAPLVIVVIGEGVAEYRGPLFEKLRPWGVLLTKVDPAKGMDRLVDILVQRASRFPQAYSHWYVDGGRCRQVPGGISTVSYAELDGPRSALLRKMDDAITKGRAGPEHVRTLLAELSAEQLGTFPTDDPILRNFQLTLLADGSGTQVFSTTFVQWAAHEVLRRAEPLTLLARFAPRQRQRSLDDLLKTDGTQPKLDPLGSLIDGEMAAYYTWLGQRRLNAGRPGSFLVWFEGHGQALAIGPSLPAGTDSPNQADLSRVVEWITT